MIDFNNYQNVLYNETKKVLGKIIEENKDEEIYGIGYYYSSPEWSYITPCILTKKEYEEDLELSGEEVEEKLTMDQFIIKWSYSERESFEKYEESFEEIDDVLNEVNNCRYELGMDFLNESATEEINNITNIQNEIALSVLETLKKEGFFDSLDLDKTIINMWWYEQENKEMLEWAKRLNNKKAYELLEKDFLESLEYDLSTFKEELYIESKKIFNKLLDNEFFGFKFSWYSNNRILPLAFKDENYDISKIEREVFYDSFDELNYSSTHYFLLLDEYRKFGFNEKVDKLTKDLKDILKEVLIRVSNELSFSHKKRYIWWNKETEEI